MAKSSLSVSELLRRFALQMQRMNGTPRVPQDDGVVADRRELHRERGELSELYASAWTSCHIRRGSPTVRVALGNEIDAVALSHIEKCLCHIIGELRRRLVGEIVEARLSSALTAAITPFQVRNSRNACCRRAACRPANSSPAAARERNVSECRRCASLSSFALNGFHPRVRRER